MATLALTDDTPSLNLILAALSDANPDIREAAVEAIIQSGRLAAFPTLQSVFDKD